ncbi:MAG: alpha/beta fold hydrolase [Actinomycetota bacterium]
MNVQLADGYSIFVHEVGEGFPLFLLHGGPGLDHTSMSPWLDGLGDEFRLLYLDQRGQGRSERVDPSSLSLEGFAEDVDLLAEALGLEEFALLGHSFGAIVTTLHAIERGTAAAYVISGGGDSSDKLMEDVNASLAALGEQGKAIADSWEQEKHVQTDEELAGLLRAQYPFHFAGDPPAGFGDRIIGSPEVLRHFANEGYGDFDFTSDLERVTKPTLIIVGELDQTTTTRAASVLHEGIPGSELIVVPGAGHMSFVEGPETYLGAVRAFLQEAVS